MIDNQEFAKIFSNNLRSVMYSREISQAQMSSELKIAKTTISGWMNGKRVPKMDKIDLLCSYLNCSRTDLMEPPGSRLRKVVKGVKKEGDVVIVRCQPDAESGQVVIAQVNGDSATCKKLVKHSNGISLVSFNHDYEPMYFSNEDIEKLPVTIIGKVVENRQKY